MSFDSKKKTHGFLPMLPPVRVVGNHQMWRGFVPGSLFPTNLWQGHCASNLVPAIAWLLVCQVGGPLDVELCFRTAPQNPGKFVADKMRCSCSMLIHNSVHFVSQKDHWLSFVTLSLPRIKRSKYCVIMCPLEESLIVTEGFLWMASFGCSLYAWPSLNSSCPDVSGAWSQWEQLWRRQRTCDLLKVSKRIVDMFWLFGISDVVKKRPRGYDYLWLLYCLWYDIKDFLLGICLGIYFLDNPCGIWQVTSNRRLRHRLRHLGFTDMKNFNLGSINCWGWPDQHGIYGLKWSFSIISCEAGSLPWWEMHQCLKVSEIVVATMEIYSDWLQS